MNLSNGVILYSSKSTLYYLSSWHILLVKALLHKFDQITLILKIINLHDTARQNEGHSCANFVCLYFYVAIILSIQYLTEDEWLSYFNYKYIYIYINTNRTIIDF